MQNRNPEIDMHSAIVHGPLKFVLHDAGLRVRPQKQIICVCSSPCRKAPDHPPRCSLHDHLLAEQPVRLIHSLLMFLLLDQRAEYVREMLVQRARFTLVNEVRGACRDSIPAPLIPAGDVFTRLSVWRSIP